MGSGKADLGQNWQEEAAQGSSAAALSDFEEGITAEQQQRFSKPA